MKNAEYIDSVLGMNMDEFSPEEIHKLIIQAEEKIEKLEKKQKKSKKSKKKQKKIKKEIKAQKKESKKLRRMLESIQMAKTPQTSWWQDLLVQSIPKCIDLAISAFEQKDGLVRK